MNKWLLLLLLLIVWWIWVIACATQAALRQKKDEGSTDTKAGTSILPGFPLFPLAFWGVALLIDHRWRPWGTWAIAGLHLTYGVFLIWSIRRVLGRLRALS